MSFKDKAKEFGIKVGFQAAFRGLKRLAAMFTRLFMLATAVSLVAHTVGAAGNANWTSVDDSGATVLTAAQLTRGVGQRGLAMAHYRFTALVQSGWLFLRPNGRFEICLNPNTGAEAQTANDTEVTILTSTTLGTPALVDSRIILGITLTGVASTGGVTNDCIHDFDSGATGSFVLADPQVAPLANDAYVTVKFMEQRKGF